MTFIYAVLISIILSYGYSFVKDFEGLTFLKKFMVSLRSLHVAAI